MFLFFFLQGCFWTKTDVIPSENDTETLSQLEDDLPEVGVQIETSGPITCENPQLRDQEPMYLANFGETIKFPTDNTAVRALSVLATFLLKHKEEFSYE